MQTNGIQTNIENAEKETKEMQTASDATQDALREGADLIAELKEQATQTAEINRATRTTTEELDKIEKSINNPIKKAIQKKYYTPEKKAILDTLRAQKKVCLFYTSDAADEL